mgnify:CR=1 FL=1
MVRSNAIKHAFSFLHWYFKGLAWVSLILLLQTLRRRISLHWIFAKFLLKDQEYWWSFDSRTCLRWLSVRGRSKIACLKETQGVETTSQPVSTNPSFSRPPSSSQDTRFFFRKKMDKLLCIEVKVVTVPPPPKANQRVRQTACPTFVGTHSITTVLNWITN